MSDEPEDNVSTTQRNSFIPPVPPPPSRPFESIDLYKDKVGGWLLLLCIGLSIISPLIMVGNVSTTYDNNKSLFAMYPVIQHLVFTYAVLQSGIALFSFYAGVNLWRKKPGAILLTKQYMVTALICMVVITILPILFNTNNEISTNWISSIGMGLFQMFIYVVVWYSYLVKSKRVKSLFSDIPYKANNMPFFLILPFSILLIIIIYLMINVHLLANQFISELPKSSVPTQSEIPSIFSCEQGNFSIKFPSGLPIPTRMEQNINSAFGKMLMVQYSAEYQSQSWIIMYLVAPPKLLKNKSEDQILRDSIEGARKNTGARITRHTDYIWNGKFKSKLAYMVVSENNQTAYMRYDARIIDGKEYIILYSSSNENDLDSAITNAFFNSFVLLHDI